MDRVGTCSMPGAHVPVALSDGTADAEVTVFTVHIVDS